jgi:hypothetical protein
MKIRHVGEEALKERNREAALDAPRGVARIRTVRSDDRQSGNDRESETVASVQEGGRT